MIETPTIWRLERSDVVLGLVEGGRKERMKEEERARRRRWHQNNERNVVGNPITSVVIGTLAEIAMCRLFGLTWSREGFYGPDSKEEVESRARRVPGQGPDLGINIKDHKKQDRPYVLSHVDPDKFWSVKIVGWIWAVEAYPYWKESEYYEDGICFVPPERTRDLQSLVDLLDSGNIKWQGQSREWPKWNYDRIKQSPSTNYVER